MGIRSFFGLDAEETHLDDGWTELSRDLGMELRRSKGDFVALTGVLDRHRTTVVRSRGKVKIEVKFRSDLRSFSIRSRSKNLKTNRVDVLTGDELFDPNYRVLIHKNQDPSPTLEFLSSRRRRAIEALGSALPLDEIEEDELEVKFDSVPSPAELRDAISLCVQVAKSLDVASLSTPQDTIVETPQDKVVDRRA